ncbi:MAG: hypothetical protein AAGG55_05175 [Pseudomonadota bacterium]
MNAILNNTPGPQDFYRVLHCLLIDEAHTHTLYQSCLKLAPRLEPHATECFVQAAGEDEKHAGALRLVLDKLGRDVPAPTGNALARAVGDSFSASLMLLCRLERESVRRYAWLCRHSMEHDYSLFDLAYRNMQDNLLHLRFVTDTLGELTPGVTR